EAPEPARPAPAAVPLPGRYDPIPVGEERVPPRPRPPEEPPPARLVRPPPPGPRRPHPRLPLNPHNPPVPHAGPDSRERSCADCLLEFRGATLCEPCKNFRVRTLQRPPRLSGKALASVLIGMLTWPLVFCLIVVGINANAPAWALVALPPNLAALALGL